MGGPESTRRGSSPDATTGSVIGGLNTTPEIFPVGTGTTHV